VSHAEFLRDHHDGPEDDVVTLIGGLWQAGERAARLPMSGGLELLASAVDGLLDRAPSLADQRALLHAVVRLAWAPRTWAGPHLGTLRQAGLSDRELHDVVHVVACFSYMNRLADGLGVEAIAERDPWATRLLGRERLAEHRAWAKEGRALRRD